MATNFLRKTKTVLTNPISSKTIYPFVVNKKVTLDKVSTQNDFLEMGRLIRPINSNIYYEADLAFQCVVPPHTGNKLNIKYEAELYKDGIPSNFISEGVFTLDGGFNGYTKTKIIFDNTNNNNEIRIAVSAINEVPFNVASYANHINLVYLERKEE